MQFFNSRTYLIQHVNVQLQTDAYFATYLYENYFLKLYHFYRYEHFDYEESVYDIVYSNCLQTASQIALLVKFVPYCKYNVVYSVNYSLV